MSFYSTIEPPKPPTTKSTLELLEKLRLPPMYPIDAIKPVQKPQRLGTPKKRVEGKTDNKKETEYVTWYAFKKELQRRTGLAIINGLWLKIKPQMPLPWSEYQLKATISQLSNNIAKLRTCPRCGGNMLIEKDTHGWYKCCLQCSFGVELNIKTIRDNRRAYPLTN